MQIINIHRRQIAKPRNEVANLMLSLATENDQVWPHELWVPIRFQTDLEVGAQGGHGPIKYTIDHYQPDEKISFVFTSPVWLKGYHQILLTDSGVGCQLEHEIVAQADFVKYLVWLLIIRPIHNAVIEDCFTKVERSLGLTPQVIEWTWWVKLLRRLKGYA